MCGCFYYTNIFTVFFTIALTLHLSSSLSCPRTHFKHHDFKWFTFNASNYLNQFIFTLFRLQMKYSKHFLACLVYFGVMTCLDKYCSVVKAILLFTECIILETFTIVLHENLCYTPRSLKEV